MTSDVDTLSKLLQDSKYNVSDIEFMINYLEKEDISAQLAMRRIKTYDKLKEKIENNTDKEEINQLKTDIEQRQKENEELKNSLEDVTKNKDDAENMSGLHSSEADQLREQLIALQEVHQQDVESASESSKSIVDRLNQLVIFLEKIVTEQQSLRDLFQPLLDYLNPEKTMPDDAHEIYIKQIDQIMSIIQEEAVSEYQKKGASQTRSVSPQTNLNRAKIKKTDEGEESAKKVENKKPAKSSGSQGADEETLKVLNLFQEFIEEAHNDQEFKTSITAICETDEAYIHLGSIAISQVYSFQSKGIEKKEQLIKILNTWKQNGVPR